MSKHTTFMELVLDGRVAQDEIDDFIDLWHDDETADEPLHQFLGMTRAEYELWVEQPGALRLILAAREEHDDNLYGAIERYAEMEPVATRAADPDTAKVVVRWLRSTGRI